MTADHAGLAIAALLLIKAAAAAVVLEGERMRKFLGLRWFGWLNFLILQWFGVRLARIADGADGRTLGWTWLRWVMPLSGWWFPYVRPHFRHLFFHVGLPALIGVLDLRIGGWLYLTFALAWFALAALELVAFYMVGIQETLRREALDEFRRAFERTKPMRARRDVRAGELVTTDDVDVEGPRAG